MKWCNWTYKLEFCLLLRIDRIKHESVHWTLFDTFENKFDAIFRWLVFDGRAINTLLSYEHFDFYVYAICLLLSNSYSNNMAYIIIIIIFDNLNISTLMQFKLYTLHKTIKKKLEKSHNNMMKRTIVDITTKLWDDFTQISKQWIEKI